MSAVFHAMLSARPITLKLEFCWCFCWYAADQHQIKLLNLLEKDPDVWPLPGPPRFALGLRVAQPRKKKAKRVRRSLSEAKAKTDRCAEAFGEGGLSGVQRPQMLK